jgi:hypothetical protein
VAPHLSEGCGGEEAFWAEKKAAQGERRRERRERRARMRFLEADLNCPNSTLDIEKNSPEWDKLWRTFEESSTSRISSDE